MEEGVCVDFDDDVANATCVLEIRIIIPNCCRNF